MNDAEVAGVIMGNAQKGPLLLEDMPDELPIAIQTDCLASTPCHHPDALVDGSPSARRSLEAELQEAVTQGNVSSAAKVMDALAVSGENSEDGLHEAGSHLTQFAEDELCKAILAGDSFQIIQCARLVEVVGHHGGRTSSTSGVSGDGRLAGSHTSSSNNAGRSAASARRMGGQRRRRIVCGRTARAVATAGRLSPATEVATLTDVSTLGSLGGGAASRGVRGFWEAEVENAWRRRDAGELAWALQLADEAGVPADRLEPARLALTQLAQAALVDAVQQGDPAKTAQALRTAESLGVGATHLAEARLMAAEFARDPHLIAQELRLAEEAGVAPERIAEAMQLVQLFKDAERHGSLRPNRSEGEMTARDSGATCSTRPSSSCPRRPSSEVVTRGQGNSIVSCSSYASERSNSASV